MGRQSAILFVSAAAADLASLVADLEGRGCAVRVAPDAGTAQASALQDTPDVVVLDSRDAPAAALELCQWFRRHERLGLVPVLLLVPGNDGGAVARGLAAGAVDFLTPPLRAGALLAHLGSFPRSPSRVTDSDVPLGLLHETLMFVAHGGWNSADRPFLESLAGHLAEVLGVEHVVISELLPGLRRVRTVVWWAHGAALPPAEYDLAGTPCVHVAARKLCVFPDGVQERFPGDPTLGQLGVCSYAGIPLWGADGQPLGLVAVMGTRPLLEHARVATLLEIVALRASHELERRRHDAEMARHRARLEEEVRERTRDLAAVLAATRTGLWELDVARRQLHLDGACLGLVGGETQERTAPLDTWLQRIHADDVPEMVARFRAGMARRQLFEIEVRAQHLDGSWRWFLLRGLGVESARGPAGRVAGTVTDITERKRGEALVKEARDAALAASQAKSIFLSRISHELRTPLTAILGYSQLLRRRASREDAEIQDGLKVLQGSGEHLLGVVNDLLDLAKVEAGRMSLSVSDVELAPFLEALAALVRPRVEAKGLAFRLDTGPDLPHAVCLDELRLRQVLLNLLTNAVKCTPRGEVVLAVHRLPAPARRVGLRWAVADTGMGLAPEAQERLFQPFAQLGRPEEQGEGTGLGLAISQQLVGLMGSRIRVDSAPGQGARFWFDVEVPEARRAPLPPPEASEILGYHGPVRTGLVVDDDGPCRGVMARALRRLGLEVRVAEHGGEALAMARAEPPDIVLMDLYMPVMDGVEAARRMREDPRLAHIPMVAVSASTREEDHERAHRAGFRTFITKPFHLELVTEVLQQHLRLEWRTAAAPARSVIPTPVMADVPRAELRALRQLALLGDLAEVAAQAQRLGEQHPEAASTWAQLAQCARGFEEGRLMAMLDAALEHAT